MIPTVGEVYADRYRIVRRLGEGGMGTVFEATDTVLDRRIALKVVSPALADREAYQERFAREAALLARVRSRHIVHIHEYGQVDDTVYLTTELFPDGDLRNRLALRGALDRREALSITAQLCEALADAHEVRVVHRDVKPANVLLWERSGQLLAYLADFGIAVDGTGGSSGGLTRTGGVVGSPAYMAPERHLGADADERGDLYSLGCVLWAALTGSAPYAGTDFQVISAHVHDDVPRLATGQTLDERIDALLARAMDKDPEQRFATAQEMRAEVVGILADIDAGRLAVVPSATPGAAAGAGSDPASGAAGATRFVERDSGTVIRSSSSEQEVAAVAGGASEPPPALRAESPEDAAPTRVRRRGLLVVALLLLVALVAGVAVASLGGDEPAPSATDPTTGASTSSDAAPADPTSPGAADPPARPEVSAEPAYRSVRFTLAADDPDAELEVDTGGGWRPVRSSVLTVPTERGGQRACVAVRGVGATGDGVTRCGRSQPPRVSLYRDEGPCSRTIDGTVYPCTYYSVRVEGLEPGSSPRAEVLPVGAQPWCSDPAIGRQFCRPVQVGDDGRGRIAKYFAILTDSGSVRLRVAGVTSGTVRLFCGAPCS